MSFFSSANKIKPYPYNMILSSNHGQLWIYPIRIGIMWANQIALFVFILFGMADMALSAHVFLLTINALAYQN